MKVRLQELEDGQSVEVLALSSEKTDVQEEVHSKQTLSAATQKWSALTRRGMSLQLWVRPSESSVQSVAKNLRKNARTGPLPSGPIAERP